MIRAIAVLLSLILALALTATLSAAPGPKAKPIKVKVVPAGELFCPSIALIFDAIIIQSGRCYTLFVLRDSRGSFLAFAAPEARIPPGQLVRLTTPAGAKLKGRIFYLIPLRANVVLVPLNTVILVPVRIDDFGPSLTITLTNANVSVTFRVRL